MRPYFIYIIEIFLCSGLFLLLYRWLIVRKVNYAFCRTYLIIAMLLSVTIPILNVPLYPAQTIYMKVPVMAQPVHMVQAPEAESRLIPTDQVKAPISESAIIKASDASISEEITPRTTHSLTPEQKWRLFFMTAYGIGLLLSLVLVLHNIITVARIKRASRVTHTGMYDLAENDAISAPFSFMHTVFMGVEPDDKTRHHILSHESSHVRHRHTIEKLIMSVLRSLFWFNPFMWIAEKRLEEVQEWQADHDALADGYNLTEYRLSIIKQLFGCNPEMTSGLKSSLTKQRFLQMKQPEIKGGTASQTIATTLLAAGMFICFGCKPADRPTQLPEYSRTKSILIMSNGFSDKIDMENTRYLYYRKNGQRKDSLEDISIVEDFNRPFPNAVIAVNGIKTANSLSDKELNWVNESTITIINGAKMTIQEARQLNPEGIQKIYYFKPKGKKAQKKYGFVFINTGQPNVIGIENFNPVVIDNPDLDIPDIVSVMGEPGLNAGNLFTYNSKGATVAAPEMKYAVEGRLVDVQTFLDARTGQNGTYTTVYRNDAAKDRFGKDVWEVVDLNYNRKAFIITFDYDENGEVSASIGYNAHAKSTDDEIRAQLATVLEYNRSRGETTRIQALSYVSESNNEMIDEWIGRLVDRSTPDIEYYFQKGQRSIVLFNNTKDLPKNIKTIFSKDSVVTRSDSRRNTHRIVAFQTGDKEYDKPNRVHIDEYDNMFVTTEQPTDETGLREIINGLPGISVDQQGLVTVNGRKVRKILLNGDETDLH